MGIVLAWTTGYNGSAASVDSRVADMPTLADGVHDVMASHLNTLADIAIELETNQADLITTVALHTAQIASLVSGVAGPVTSTANAIATWGDATGDSLLDSLASVSLSGDIATPGDITSAKTVSGATVTSSNHVNVGGRVYLTETTGPAGIAGKGILYAKDSGSVAHLFYVDDTSVEHQITQPGGISGGVYTPSFIPTEPANTTISSPADFLYTRIGNLVQVSGRISIDTTGITAFPFQSVDITLPVAAPASSGSAYFCSGQYVCEFGSTMRGPIWGQAGGDGYARMQFLADSAGPIQVAISFMYTIA